MLKTAHDRGARAALVFFKIAGPMGADIAVQPRGPEVSHGTEAIQYARRDAGPLAPASAARADMPDWLWNLSSYDRQAPGRADGSYGQETIG